VRLDDPEPLKNRSGKLEVGSAERPNSLLPASDSRFLLFGWYEPTARARVLLKNREYRYISPAIDWAARSKTTGKPQGTTLTSVALTNRPFLEELPQIRLSDPAFRPADENDPRNSARTPRASFQFPISSFQNSQGGIMKLATLSVADGRIRVSHEDLNEDFFLDPEELKKVLEQLGMLPEPAALAEALPGRDITLGEARRLLSENDARGKAIPAAEFFRAEVERELEEAVRAGRILPRQRDDWRRIALADLPMFRRILAAMKSRVPVAPVGFAGAGPGDAQTHVKFLAEQRMRERGVTFGQALSEIGREQPDLVQQYRRAVAGTE
jgi:hypothetical protein